MLALRGKEAEVRQKYKEKTSLSNSYFITQWKFNFYWSGFIYFMYDCFACSKVDAMQIW